VECFNSWKLNSEQLVLDRSIILQVPLDQYTAKGIAQYVYDAQDVLNLRAILLKWFSAREQNWPGLDR